MTTHNDVVNPIQPQHYDLAAHPPERFPDPDDDSTEANDEDDFDDDDDEDEDEDEENDDEQLDDA